MSGIWIQTGKEYNSQIIESEMEENIITKNGKGYTFTISYVGSVVAIVVGLITIVTAFLLPYKTFADFKHSSEDEIARVRDKSIITDSVASLSLRYAIENSWNMREFFANGQPKNYSWKSYEEITQKFYPMR